MLYDPASAFRNSRGVKILAKSIWHIPKPICTNITPQRDTPMVQILSETAGRDITAYVTDELDPAAVQQHGTRTVVPQLRL